MLNNQQTTRCLDLQQTVNGIDPPTPFPLISLVSSLKRLKEDRRPNESMPPVADFSGFWARTPVVKNTKNKSETVFIHQLNRQIKGIKISTKGNKMRIFAF